MNKDTVMSWQPSLPSIWKCKTCVSHFLQCLHWTAFVSFTPWSASSSSSHHAPNALPTISNTFHYPSNCFAMSKVVSSLVINCPVPYLGDIDLNRTSHISGREISFILFYFIFVRLNRNLLVWRKRYFLQNLNVSYGRPLVSHPCCNQYKGWTIGFCSISLLLSIPYYKHSHLIHA